MTNDQRLFFFGGFDHYSAEMANDIRFLDLKTSTWTTIHATENWPAKRSGHTAVIRNNAAIIFGGEIDTEEDEDEENILHFYNITTNQWIIPDVDKINTPPSRSRHAACLSPDLTKMVVSGGLLGKEVMNDLWWFDFNNNSWYGPVEFVYRFDHKLAVYNNKIWAFGGLTPDMDRITEVAWYDFESNTLGKVHVKNLDYDGPNGMIHFYDAGYVGTMLDVVVPGMIPNAESSIAALDMDTLGWRTIVDDGACSEIFGGYNWYYMVAMGSTIVLVGQPRADLESNGETLSHVLTVDLSEYGYYGHQAINTFSNKTAGGGTMADDMYEFYKRSEMCDFEITALASEERPLNGDYTPDMEICPPIKVHRMVLAARWPHFQRILSSGMTEQQTSKLFISEPKSWVRRLIEYMYRDSIDECDMNETTGLMILANLYELPRLRKLCIEKVTHEISIDNAVMIWDRAVTANEKILRYTAVNYILKHWGIVVRTRDFAILTRERMLMLCSESDERSTITTTSGRNSPHFETPVSTMSRSESMVNSNNGEDHEVVMIENVSGSGSAFSSLNRVVNGNNADEDENMG